MDLKDVKKKLRLKQELMFEAGAYFEGLSDFTEPANCCKAKDYARKSRRSFMKDYKKALSLIDKMFIEQPVHNTAVAEAGEDKVKSKKGKRTLKQAEDQKENIPLDQPQRFKGEGA